MFAFKVRIYRATMGSMSSLMKVNGRFRVLNVSVECVLLSGSSKINTAFIHFL